ncbi:MAG: PEP-CTERM sorting domain-containing protein [Pseudomonadota bacterium]|jgi:hypothetical protein
MKLKLTALAGAAALALTSGYASALVIPMSSGNSEMWFSVWDPVNLTSYTRDLGFFQNTLTTASVAGQTGVIQNTNGLSMQFGPDALLTQFLADSAANLDKLRWNVAGGDGTGLAAGNRRIIVTAQENVTKTQIQNLASQQMSNMISAADTYVNAVNSNTLGTHQTQDNGSHIEVMGDGLGNDNSYAGGGLWGPAFGGNGNFQNAGFLGDSLNFWWLSNGSSAIAKITATQFLGLGGNVATWTLANDGTLTFAAVPEAETWALLGLGLLGVGALTRRRGRALPLA